MTTVKLNATGRYVLMNRLDDDDELHERIGKHGIMDPVRFDEPELERLLEIADSVDSTDVHWLNTRSRIRRALQNGVFA